MADSTIGDTSFGLQAQALAILALLAQREPTFAEWDEETHSYLADFRTFPWYNGREKGVAITLRRLLRNADPDRHQNTLVITFGEDRHSNEIFVQQWLAGDDEMPPLQAHLEDRCERGMEHRREFHQYNYGPVLDFIIDSMTRFYASEGPAFENVIPLPVGNLRGFSANDGAR